MGGLPSVLNPILSNALLNNEQSFTYRPPQWGLQKLSPALISVTTEASNVVAGGTATSTALGVNGGFTYVFDAVLRADHSQELQITQHPVQTGSAISSHAFLIPATLSLSIGMSDAMQEFFPGDTGMGAPGAFGPTTALSSWNQGNGSKSVAAYSTMRQWQAQRTLLTIVTRLRTYRHMLLRRLSPIEDHTTITGLKCHAEFQQVFIASIGNDFAQPNSARANLTNSTSQNLVAPIPASNSLIAQFRVLSILNQLQDITAYISSPGAGTWSSTNVANLRNFIEGL